MKYFSMFSGIGGFEYGIGNKSDCVGFSEVNKYAIKCYQHHFPSHKNYGDAKKINTDDLPDFDLLCGGFPCQSFSIAGKRQGFQDTRGTLFHEIVRIAKAKRPRLLLLENVKGLLSADDGRCFATIVLSLDELGYDVEWEILNSKYFGVPQNRERVFIVGHLRGQPFTQVFPLGRSNEEDSRVEQGKEIIDVMDSDREISRVYSPDGIAPTLHLKTGGWQEPKIQITGNIYPSKHEAGNIYETHGISPTIKCNGPRPNSKNIAPKIVIPVLTPNRENKRQNGRRFKDNGEPAFTLIGQDIHGVMVMNTVQEAIGSRTGSSATFKASIERMAQATGQIRRLTPTECERLQGFPDGWTKMLSDTQRYKCLGNAVTTNVVSAIAERISQRYVL